jgi:mannose-6-phosphate isomerase-like protein (cupin superfamily)
MLVGLALLTAVACAPGQRDPRLIWVGADGVRVERASEARTGLTATIPGVRAGTWGATADATYQLIEAEVSERPHVHDAHDLTVVLLRGRGDLRVDGASIPMHAGDVVHLTRGRAHHFHPAAGKTLGLAIYTPRLTGRDSRDLGE